jgi:beta-phosphoglucomutase
MKALLFDLDGTLVDTEKLDDMAMWKILKKIGISSNKKFIGCTLKEYIQGITKDKSLQERIKKEFTREYEFILKSTELKLNHKLLSLLKKSYNLKIALVTSNNRRLTRIILTKLGLESFFDIIITTEDVRKNKPHPEPYLKAMEKLGVNPADCIAFEDSKEGIKSAIAAGIDYKKIKLNGRKIK